MGCACLPLINAPCYGWAAPTPQPPGNFSKVTSTLYALGISAPCFAAGGTLGVLCLGDSPCPTLVQRSSNPRPSIYIANPKAENTSIPRERHSHSFPSASSEDARSAPCQQKVHGCRAGRGHRDDGWWHSAITLSPFQRWC